MWPHKRTGRENSAARPAGAHYAALRRESKLRTWLLVGIPAAAIGLLAGARLAWWLGLLAASVIVIGLSLWDRHFGVISGRWPGDQGRHRLAAVAARLERHGWTVIREPHVPIQDLARPDHLFIGPGGVFVVERQVWTVEDAVTTNSGTGLLLVGGRPAARRAASVRAAAAVIDEALSDNLSQETSVRSVLAIHGLTLDRPRSTVGIDIVPIADLPRFLRHAGVVLSAPEIETITHTTRRLFGPR